MKSELSHALAAVLQQRGHESSIVTDWQPGDGGDVMIALDAVQIADRNFLDDPKEKNVGRDCWTSYRSEQSNHGGS